MALASAYGARACLVGVVAAAWAEAAKGRR